MLLLTILLLSATFAAAHEHADGHSCVHDSVQKSVKVDVDAQDYGDVFSDRKRAEVAAQPMRIRFELKKATFSLFVC